MITDPLPTPPPPPIPPPPPPVLLWVWLAIILNDGAPPPAVAGWGAATRERIIEDIARVGIIYHRKALKRKALLVVVVDVAVMAFEGNWTAIFGLAETKQQKY